MFGKCDKFVLVVVLTAWKAKSNIMVSLTLKKHSALRASCKTFEGPVFFSKVCLKVTCANDTPVHSSIQQGPRPQQKEFQLWLQPYKNRQSQQHCQGYPPLCRLLIFVCYSQNLKSPNPPKFLLNLLEHRNAKLRASLIA